ncbi:MAG: SRPBCC family protein [Paludibacter sp.]|nr:SRPBCC family protein [Paludibacter sp.]
MTTYESDIKTISLSEEVVFNVLSDLNNLRKVTENPTLNDKVKDLEFDTDTCSFTVSGIGKIGFRIIGREPYKTIHFKAEHTPIPVNVSVDLMQITDNSTQLKLTLNAEIPTMIKMMVDKRLKDGMNTFADLLVTALTLNPQF